MPESSGWLCVPGRGAVGMIAMTHSTLTAIATAFFCVASTPQNALAQDTGPPIADATAVPGDNESGPHSLVSMQGRWSVVSTDGGCADLEFGDQQTLETAYEWLLTYDHEDEYGQHFEVEVLADGAVRTRRYSVITLGDDATEVSFSGVGFDPHSRVSLELRLDGMRLIGSGTVSGARHAGCQDSFEVVAEYVGETPPVTDPP